MPLLGGIPIRATLPVDPRQPRSLLPEEPGNQFPIAETYILRQFGHGKPPHLTGIASCPQFPPHRLTEIDNHIGGLPWIVAHPDHVKQTLNVNLKPRLLPDFPLDSRLRLLINLLVACGKSPGTLVGRDSTTNQKNLTARGIQNQPGGGTGWVEEIHEAAASTPWTLAALDISCFQAGATQRAMGRVSMGHDEERTAVRLPAYALRMP